MKARREIADGIDDNQDDNASKSMSFLDHLAELRRLLIISFVALAVGSAVSFIIYERVINLLYYPLTVLAQSEDGNLLYINTIFEGFLTRFKISILAGTVFSFPVHLFGLMRFTFPGLHAKEKRGIIISLAASFVFIVTIKSSPYRSHSSLGSVLYPKIQECS